MLLAAGCISWLVILVPVIFVLSGHGFTGGWILAGAAILAIAVWVGLISYQVRTRHVRKNESLMYLGGESGLFHPVAEGTAAPAEHICLSAVKSGEIRR